MSDELPIIEFATQADWETWIIKNHETSKGLWLKIAKKGSGIPSVTYAEALEVALCYGWIDGQKGSFDSHYFLQRFTHRGKRSKWSKINCAKVEQLIQQGRMQAPGLAEIDAAKQDGRWEMAYAPQSTIEVPEDFQSELETHPEAARAFALLNKSARYSILFRIHDAKKPETRRQRIQKFVAMLEQGENV